MAWSCRRRYRGKLVQGRPQKPGPVPRYRYQCDLRPALDREPHIRLLEAMLHFPRRCPTTRAGFALLAALQVPAQPGAIPIRPRRLHQRFKLPTNFLPVLNDVIKQCELLAWDETRLAPASSHAAGTGRD